MKKLFAALAIGIGLSGSALAFTVQPYSYNGPSNVKIGTLHEICSGIASYLSRNSATYTYQNVYVLQPSGQLGCKFLVERRHGDSYYTDPDSSAGAVYCATPNIVNPNAQVGVINISNPDGCSSQ